MSKNQNAGSSIEMNFCVFIGLTSYQDYTALIAFFNIQHQNSYSILFMFYIVEQITFDMHVKKFISKETLWKKNVRKKPV